MKLLIETGSESHTTSSASLQAKYHGGEHDGKFLYQVKSRQVSAEWNTVQGGKWITTVYELPEGTEITVIGKGRTGPRGERKHNTRRIYRLDANVEVLTTTINTGLHACDLKGRLVLVRDIIESRENAIKTSQEEGF